MYACMTGCMYVYVCLGALSGVVSLLYVCVMSNVLQCTVESIYIYIYTSSTVLQSKTCRDVRIYPYSLRTGGKRERNG